jgi:vancomycin resistance protein YoaR
MSMKIVLLLFLLLSCAKPVPSPMQDAESEPPVEASDAESVEAEAEAGPPTLSMFATQFDPIDGRTTNITTAAGKIDGHVVEPNAVFSFNDVVGIRTAKNGYVSAPVLLQGRRTDDLGGGVCQVSSTLHAAAVLGGFVVVERRPHSLVPKYIEPGYDATVAFPASCEIKDAPCGKLDLKIRNPFSAPVTIRARVADSATVQPDFLGGEPARDKKVLFIWIEGLDPQMTVTITKQTEPMGRGGRRWVRSGKILTASHVKVVQQADYGYFVRSTATYARDGQETWPPFKWFSRYPPVDEVWEVGWARPADAGDPW